MDTVLSGLHMDVLLPYSQLLLSSPSELPGSFLSLELRSGHTRWYIFPEAEALAQIRAELTVLIRVRALIKLWSVTE